MTLAGAGLALADDIRQGRNPHRWNGCSAHQDARITSSGWSHKRCLEWRRGRAVGAGRVAVVDATGKYIIPGLIDSRSLQLVPGELFLHYGVTSVFGDLGAGSSGRHGMQEGGVGGDPCAAGATHKPHSVTVANGKADKFAGMNTARSRVYANVNSPADAEAAIRCGCGQGDIITLNEDWNGEVFSAISKAAHARA